MGERFEMELEEAPRRGGRRSRPAHAPANAPVLTGQQPPLPPRGAFGPRLVPEDSEPVGEARDGGAAAERRRAAVIGSGVAVGLVLVVAGFALGRSTGAGDDGAGEIAAATTTVAPTTTESALERRAEALPGVGTVGTPRDTTTTSAPGAVTTLDLGRPLLPAPFGTELVGLTTDGRLMELDLDTGVATFTDLPRGLEGDPIVMAGNTGTLVTDPYIGAGYFVPRGGRPQRWTGWQDGWMGMLPWPGPTADTIWLAHFGPADTVELQLATIAGEPIGDPIPITSGYPTMSDGAGGVLVTAPGGTYRVGTDGTRRVTTGNVVASGPGGLMVVDCDELLVCTGSLLQPATGEQRPVAIADVGALARGGWLSGFPSVAPDGGAIVVYQYGDGTGGDEGLALLDLSTGLSTVLSPQFGPWWSFGWSPDGRFGVYLDDGKLFYVDRPLRSYLPVHDELPQLRTFTTRPIAPPEQSG